MKRFVCDKQKKTVCERAEKRCEYCRLPDLDSYYGFQADHIISWRHGGKTELNNLAYACPDCNRSKGTDLGTLLDDSDVLIPFFHPRKDEWDIHFELHASGLITAKSGIGRATIKILAFNHPDRIIERQLMIRLQLMPLPEY